MTISRAAALLLAPAVLLSLAAAALVREPDAPAPRSAESAPAPKPKTSHVFLIMIDGLRWQEVFAGADESLMTKDIGGVEKPEPLIAKWIRPSREERRELLMPFLWTTIAKQGQLFGDRTKASEVNITNAAGVSYPGYAETLCGFADPLIKDNRQFPNPNPTVLEWLAAKPDFKGRVAAFGAWETFSFIFRKDACGFPVDDGTRPIESSPLWGVIPTEWAVINQLRAETPYRWGAAAFDSFVFRAALPWIKANKPRAVFWGMGETDEWAHEYNYAAYLDAAHRADAYIKELWDTLQSMDEYRGTTTLIINPDHGRGDARTGPKAWGDHNAKNKGSENIWLAAIGPDTPALGCRENVKPLTQSQIAATLAALLGQDYNAAQPRAAAPVPDLLPR